MNNEISDQNKELNALAWHIGYILGVVCRMANPYMPSDELRRNIAAAIVAPDPLSQPINHAQTHANTPITR